MSKRVNNKANNKPSNNAKSALVDRIVTTAPFERGVKALKKDHKDEDLKKLEEVIDKLKRMEITKEKNNHGVGSSVIDLHISPNVVLLYRYNGSILMLELELNNVTDHDRLQTAINNANNATRRNGIKAVPEWQPLDDIIRGNKENESMKLREWNESPYRFIKSKEVRDDDGFITDYTWWYDERDGVHFFMFGDRDLYTPNRDYADWECDTEEEAEEWFYDYGTEEYIDDRFELKEEYKMVEWKIVYKATDKQGRQHEYSNKIEGSEEDMEEFVDHLCSTGCFDIDVYELGDRYCKYHKVGRKEEGTLREDKKRGVEININDIKGITLLSVEEAKRFPKEIRAYSYWWWLRSPGDRPDCAANVTNDGSVFYNGDFVDISDNAVRPVLIMDSPSLKSGDIVEVFGRKWYYQDGLALLMDEPLTKMAFNAAANKGNDYEKSDIKKYLDNWFKSAPRQGHRRLKYYDVIWSDGNAAASRGLGPDHYVRTRIGASDEQDMWKIAYLLRTLELPKSLSADNLSFIRDELDAWGYEDEEIEEVLSRNDYTEDDLHDINLDGIDGGDPWIICISYRNKTLFSSYDPLDEYDDDVEF